MIEYEGKAWEVDEFHADNKGLTVAEIELDEENELFSFLDIDYKLYFKISN